MTNTTLEYYNQNAATYFDQTINVDMQAMYERFLAHVPAGGHILDLGSGSGRDSHVFLERGFKVTAQEPAVTLCKMSMQSLSGRPGFMGIRSMKAQSLVDREAFHGIWSMASLLHVPANEIPQVFRAVMQALKPGGAWCMSFKQGDGERTEALTGRLFTDFTLASLSHVLMGTVGAEIGEVSLWHSQDQVPGRAGPTWINAVVRKAANAHARCGEVICDVAA